MASREKEAKEIHIASSNFITSAAEDSLDW